MPDEDDTRTARGSGDVYVMLIVLANKRRVARQRGRGLFKATFHTTAVGPLSRYHDGYWEAT